MNAVAIQDSADHSSWLRWRSKGIGGSDAPAVAGASPWATPMSLWLEKTGLIQRKEAAEEPEWQRWGHLLEPVITAEFERRSGLVVVQAQVMVEHPDRPWQRATLDGLVAEGPGSEPLGLLEIKTASWRSPLKWHDEKGNEQVPEPYRIQVQHNLMTSQLQHAWTVALMDGQKLLIHEVDADPDVQEVLLELEQDFWQCVIERRPPPVDDSEITEKALQKAYPVAPEDSSVELSEEEAQLVEDYLAAKSDETEAAKRVQAAQNALMLAMGNARYGLYRGRRLVNWTSFEKSQIDWRSFRHDYEHLFEKYECKRPERRFIVTKNGSQRGGSNYGNGYD